MTTTVEFAVQISCDTCITKIEKSLEGVEGVKNVKISRDAGTVLVESNLPSTLIQEKIESTGRKAVLKGAGDEGEKDVYMFVKLERDLAGYCPLCKPNKNVSSNSPTKTNDDVENKNDKEFENKSKNSKDSDGEGDGDELVLKYSSDLEDGDLEARAADVHSSDGDEIWKIEDDLDADFDVIDADMDEDDETKTEKSDDKSRKRKHSGSDDESNEENVEGEAAVDEKSGDKVQNTSKVNKFVNKMKSCTIRKGDMNLVNSSYAHLQILIFAEKDNESITQDEAQIIKDNLVQEIFNSIDRFKSGLEKSFILRFADCKLTKNGMVCATCHDKETFDYILNWNVPPISEKKFKVISALDKAPLQKIKFSLKTNWVNDQDSMLKLIHLQNREIDTKRWVLDSKKSLGRNMEQFSYQIDYGSVRALKKLKWSFFYELFAVKVTEYNGTPISAKKLQ